MRSHEPTWPQRGGSKRARFPIDRLAPVAQAYPRRTPYLRASTPMLAGSCVTRRGSSIAARTAAVSSSLSWPGFPVESPPATVAKQRANRGNPITDQYQPFTASTTPATNAGTNGMPANANPTVNASASDAPAEITQPAISRLDWRSAWQKSIS